MVRIRNIPSTDSDLSVEHSLLRFVGDYNSCNKLEISVKDPQGNITDCSDRGRGENPNLCLTCHDGGFIAWVLLRVHGTHVVTISEDNGSEAAVSITYKEEPKKHHVPRCEIYFILPPEPENQCIQGPDSIDCSPVGAIERIRITALLLQTFVFEDLKNGRTFLLGMDGPGVPRVNVVRLGISMAEFHELGKRWTDGGQAGFSHIIRLLDKFNAVHFPSLPQDDIKRIVYMGPTRYDSVTNKVVGQTALGGSNMALFGTGTLHCNPDCVADIPAAFTDTSLFSKNLLEDSGRRGRRRCWNCATGIGAMQHELGHAFGAAHRPHGIMARGFDYYDCFAVATSRSFRKGSHGAMKYDPRGAHFDPDCRDLHTYTSFAWNETRGYTGGYVLEKPPPKDTTAGMGSVPPEDTIKAVFECDNGARFLIHKPDSHGRLICDEYNKKMMKSFTFAVRDMVGDRLVAEDEDRKLWIKMDSRGVYLDATNPAITSLADADSKGSFRLLYKGSWKKRSL